MTASLRNTAIYCSFAPMQTHNGDTNQGTASSLSGSHLHDSQRIETIH